MLRRLEATISTLLIASRWLMAPLYLGLIVAMGTVIVGFFRELVHAMTGFADLSTDGVILAALKMIDLVLVANLVLIMVFAGVGTLGESLAGPARRDLTLFMGKIDFSGLKLKVVASLIAIAAVDLLEVYVEIGSANKADVLWRIAILLVFVVSGVLLAWMDRLVAEPHE